MKSCDAYEALLDAFAEGDLFTEDMIRVQQHLNNCPDCQAYLEDLLTIRSAFPSVEDTVVPEGFSAKVMAAVAATPQETAPAKPAVSGKKKTPWVRIMAPLAACCAIVILLQSNPIGSFKTAKQEAAPAAASDMAVTEEAPAEEAKVETAAEARITADSAIVDIPAVEASEPEYAAASAPKEEGYAPYRIRIAVDADYIGDLLADYSPLTEDLMADNDSGMAEVHYELTMEQYDALLAALADRNELPAEEVFDTDSETVLVIVRQN